MSWDLGHIELSAVSTYCVICFFSFSLLRLNLYIICFSHYFSCTLIIMWCIHWFLRSLIFYLIYPSLCLWIITGNMYHRWLRWVFNSRRRCKTGVKPSKGLHINVLEVISLHQDNFHPIIFAWVDCWCSRKVSTQLRAGIRSKLEIFTLQIWRSLWLTLHE